MNYLRNYLEFSIKSKPCFVDLQDADLLERGWKLIGRGYVANTHLGLLHRVIASRFLGDIQGLQVDHINHIKTDNRRSNLRLATNSLNHANMKAPATNTSGYKGVRKRSETAFAANIKVNQKVIYLGTYKTPEEASQVYKEAALFHFGDFAYTEQI